MALRVINLPYCQNTYDSAVRNDRYVRRICTQTFLKLPRHDQTKLINLQCCDCIGKTVLTRTENYPRTYRQFRL